MGKYTWNKEEIENRIKELSKKVENPDCEKDLKTFRCMLNILKEEDNLFEFNDVQKLEMERLSFLFQEIASKFYKASLTKNIDISCTEIINLSDDECLTLIHDFYKTCSSTFYNYFLKIFKEKNRNLQISSNLFHSSATTYHLIEDRESYINIERTNTNFDLVDFSHEYGHAITFLLNPQFVMNSNFALIRELDGYYFQTKFLDYLISNNILVEEAILAKTYIDFMITHKAKMIQFSNLIDKIRLYSYLASIELCMDKKNDSDEVLEKIIMGNPKSLLEETEILKSYITFNQSVPEFQKVLKSQIDSIFNLG